MAYAKLTIPHLLLSSGKTGIPIAEPDISVICTPGKLTDRGCTGAPGWIIEIISPSNPGDDYVRKLNLYMDAGVREYRIVDPRTKSILVYFLEQPDFQAEKYALNDKIKTGIYDYYFSCIWYLPIASVKAININVNSTCIPMPPIISLITSAGISAYSLNLLLTSSYQYTGTNFAAFLTVPFNIFSGTNTPPKNDINNDTGVTIIFTISGFLARIPVKNAIESDNAITVNEFKI